MIENFSKEELNNEQWKAIDGYDGLYEVSSLGRVRSKHSGEWRVMKPSKNENGYLIVDLRRGGKITRKMTKVHRLVAQAFIPNDDETKTIINHKNEDKTDNKVSNLERCDYRYNLTYNDIHHRRKQYVHTQPVRGKIKDLYDDKLSIDDNVKMFKTNGIECSRYTIIRLRKDLGLTKQYKPRKTKQIS